MKKIEQACLFNTTCGVMLGSRKSGGTPMRFCGVSGPGGGIQGICPDLTFLQHDRRLPSTPLLMQPISLERSPLLVDLQRHVDSKCRTQCKVPEESWQQCVPAFIIIIIIDCRPRSLSSQQFDKASRANLIRLPHPATIISTLEIFARLSPSLYLNSVVVVVVAVSDNSSHHNNNIPRSITSRPSHRILPYPDHRIPTPP